MMERFSSLIIMGMAQRIPQMGRIKFDSSETIRLPTIDEAESMGITWNERRVNRIRLGGVDFLVSIRNA